MGDKLGAYIEVVYDESKVFARWQERFLSIADPAEAARYQITESTELPPLPLAAMDPARSHDAPGLQVADMLAGGVRRGSSLRHARPAPVGLGG